MSAVGNTDKGRQDITLDRACYYSSRNGVFIGTVAHEIGMWAYYTFKSVNRLFK